MNFEKSTIQKENNTEEFEKLTEKLKPLFSASQAIYESIKNINSYSSEDQNIPNVKTRLENTLHSESVIKEILEDKDFITKMELLASQIDQTSMTLDMHRKEGQQ